MHNKTKENIKLIICNELVFFHYLFFHFLHHHHHHHHHYYHHHHHYIFSFSSPYTKKIYLTRFSGNNHRKQNKEKKTVPTIVFTTDSLFFPLFSPLFPLFFSLFFSLFFPFFPLLVYFTMTWLNFVFDLVG